MISALNDLEIIRSWNTNASQWIKTINSNEIQSRILVTNDAIIRTVLNFPTAHVLDIGCGEGWFARTLISSGINVFGVDAIPALIEQAKKTHTDNFAVCTYEELCNYEFGRKFDCVVCNFSLIGHKSTEKVIETVPSLLEKNGRFIIQTLHPAIACSDFPYVDGWRPGSWRGFNSNLGIQPHGILEL